MTITFSGLTPLLEVFDMPSSVAFYRDVLGFEVQPGNTAGWCMLKREDVTLMLNTAYDEGERPAVPDPSRVTGHADTSLYLMTPDPNEIYLHLREKGWAATAPAMTSYGMRQVSTKDPDGFQLFFLSPADK